MKFLMPTTIAYLVASLIITVIASINDIKESFSVDTETYYHEENGIAVLINDSGGFLHRRGFQGVSGTPSIGSLSSQPCDPDQGGTGNGQFEALNLEGCDSTGVCNLHIVKSHKGNFNFIAGRNDSSLILSVNAVRKNGENKMTKLSDSWYLDRPYTEKNLYEFRFSIFFATSYTNKDGIYDIQLRLWSKEDNATSICQTFPVNLNATGNSGAFLGAQCLTQYDPCAFENSMCVINPSPYGSEQLICQCDSGTYWDSQKLGCKKVVGTYCDKSEDCVTNADCFTETEKRLNFGFCDCSAGFIYKSPALYNCYPPYEGNEGAHFGETCTNPEMPCNFNNSLCGVDGSSYTCKCAPNFYYEDPRGCKKQIGASCDTNEDCITNAECKRQSPTLGYCTCMEGYAFVDNTICKANDALVLSIFLLVASQLLAVKFCKMI